MDDIFYLPQIDLKVSSCFLPEEEARHAIRVLRKQIGDKLLLTDGRGHFVESRIEHIQGKKCSVVLEEIRKEVKKQPYKIHLAVAPTKNSSRYEWLVEKATEIGVDTIIPLISFHSERRNINISRLEKILIAAMKQSQKAYLPKLKEPIRFVDFLKEPLEGLGYIAHCISDLRRESIQESYTKGEEVTLLIGPEGDFSRDEVEEALLNNFRGIHLGDSRLRTETAALVACSTIYQLNY